MKPDSVLEQPADKKDESLNLKVTASEETSVPFPKSTETDPVDKSFQNAVKECLPQYADENNSSQLVARIYQDYQNKDEIISQNVELENIHISIDNEERRIQILRDVGPNRSEYHYFKLDAEGIPEYMPLPSTNMSEWIKDQTVTYRERRVAISFKDQSYMQYEVINDQIKDWFWRGPQKSLFCQSNNCVCK